ncbi:unnamed protein product [Callosobruchus maculatus]|uniref:ZSWIM3 N-terminal domain-containing protein n=1 Tax=Callosobruchus maculatus TaxID=64391 RepID=A0A653CTZ7_CALMS|nr:unnamed protein product [Callosobruchus maculatus]
MKLGDKVNSYEDFLKELEVHKKQALTEYWMRDNRTFTSARKRVPHITEKANVNLKYYYIKYYGILGDQKLKTKEKKSNRKTSSFKQNCGSYIGIFKIN